MELRTIKICDIRVKDRMRLDKGDIEGLADSIREKGLLQPITVNEDMKLLAGERRLLAFKLLGLQEIQAVVRHGIDTVDALEVELVENVFRKEMSWTEICNLQKRLFEEKSKKGKWSQQKQAEMLSSSQPQISRQINMARALELLPELAERSNFDEAWRELKALEEDVHVEILRQKAKPSDAQHPQWAENYKVGDAIAGMTGVYSDTADFAEVDPPHPIEMNAKHSSGDFNEIDETEYEQFYERVASEVYRIIKQDSFAIFWYDWRFHSEVRYILQRVGFTVDPIPAIWIKGRGGQGNSSGSSAGNSEHEPFWIARKGSPVFLCPIGNVFDFNPVSASAKIHPTERPISLLDEILRVCCPPRGIALVPFLGSGVTMRAAQRHGCEAFGFDLSEMHRARFLKKVSEEK